MIYIISFKNVKYFMLSENHYQKIKSQPTKQKQKLFGSALLSKLFGFYMERARKEH
jgi:hypothetical protein